MNNLIIRGPRSFRAAEEHLGRITQSLPHGASQNMAIVHQINHLWKWLQEEMQEALRETRLNPITFTHLLMLYGEKDGWMTPSSLAESTGESRTNTTRICNELETMMLIRRTRNATDRRSVDLSLTARGIAQMETLLPRLRERANSALFPLTRAEKAQLEHLLKKLLAHMEEATDEA